MSPTPQPTDSGPGRDRSELIPLLQQAQAEQGYVPQAVVHEISRQLQISTSEIFGVLTFYTQFRLKPVGKHIVKVCCGTACHVRGAPLIIGAVEDELHLHGSEDTTADGQFTFEKVACFGACSMAPVMVVDAETRGNVSPDQTRKAIRKIAKAQPIEAEASHD